MTKLQAVRAYKLLSFVLIHLPAFNVAANCSGCPNGGIGVGYSQLCMPNAGGGGFGYDDGCSANSARVFEQGSCESIIDSSFDEDGSQVTCNDNNAVTEVVTPDGKALARCEEASISCHGEPFLNSNYFVEIDYCCYADDPDPTPTSTADTDRPPVSTQTTSPPLTAKFRIMPLGDSITHGYDGKTARIHFQLYWRSEIGTGHKRLPGLAGVNDINQNKDISTAHLRLGSLIDQIFNDAPDTVLLVGQVLTATGADRASKIDAYNLLVANE
ncbi:hypothetical protein BT69DRAFT_1294542, partial [Atractiella rhizophila]